MKLSFLHSLAILFAFAFGLNWQSAGNMSASNMTVIKSFIDANFTIGSEQYSTLRPKVVSFSDYLNKQWDPAWNVVVLFNNDPDSNFDAVVYGYAFNNHWMWINGLKIGKKNVGTFVMDNYGSFVIWKDYNCQGWITLDDSSPLTTFTPNPISLIIDIINSNTPQYDDIWNIAWKTVINLETVAPDFKGDHAYTMIVSQRSTIYVGRVCARNYYFSSTISYDNSNGFWGSYLILQMR